LRDSTRAAIESQATKRRSVKKTGETRKVIKSQAAFTPTQAEHDRLGTQPFIPLEKAIEFWNGGLPENGERSGVLRGG